jgi:hypothetical protein
MTPFTAPAILNVGSPTKDHGMRARIETNELTDEEKLCLLKYDGTFGYFMFKPNEVQPNEIPEGNADFKGKSPSQRLRAVLFLLHREAGGKPETFPEYYNAELEKVINSYKSRIGT